LKYLFYLDRTALQIKSAGDYAGHIENVINQSSLGFGSPFDYL